ncbi:MAG: AAA family ATPase [Acidimicrobiia bacterium]|nr:AAA family ATPase [Acidimicrobiia bacterium]MYG72641.1 AAA family ATPase [Acidimicrobiia bacterium]
MSLQDMVEVGAGGTHQARYEREIIWDSISNRLSALDIGDSSLVFGRLDWSDDQDKGGDQGGIPGGDQLYVGRVAVWDDDQEPVTIDWRAPAAEAFYRATGSDPMGLSRRRHFVTRGRELLGVEDEYFGETNGRGRLPLIGEATLRAGLEAGRTGRLADAAATIQAEQDAIIRSPLSGVLVVQGGPGTGKTVAALHRAAYLLYTHRFPLEGQGMLVLGPNRLFLTYIEQVLPSLGEAGVEVSMLADLLPGTRVKGLDDSRVSRIKGDLRMITFLRRARRDRQRPLRSDVTVGFGLRRLRLTVEQSEEIVRQARKRFRTHNRARRFVEEQMYQHLADSGSRSNSPGPDVETVRERLHGSLELREALEWMWPVLTPAHFLHDLFGSTALLRSAAGSVLTYEETELLYRSRAAHASEVVWTADDAPLLDEALALLGPRPGHKLADVIRTYGHIVVDEAQDLSPMQLRMISRRSLNGSITVVGDIAQATSAWGHDSWDSVVEHLPRNVDTRFAELSIGYRLPEPIMEVASRVLDAAIPGLVPPRSIRTEGRPPRFVPILGHQAAASGNGQGRDSSHNSLLSVVAQEVHTELGALGNGNLAVICHATAVEAISDALTDAEVDHGLVYERGLESQVTIVPVELVKGLEVDTAVVVEPADICEKLPKGMRALYVAMTRATQRLVVVHARPLPEPLIPDKE